MVKVRSKECLASGGAIFLCSYLTRKECFEKKIFGLSPSYADFVKKVKAGTTLFLFDIDQRKLHGVFEATSDGAVDIIPDAYISAGQRYPYQIRFKRIWFCKPLMEGEFQDAVKNSFVIKNKFTFHLSHQQVTKLLHLFSSRKRLQPPQNPRPQDDISRELEISSLVKETDIQSSPNSSSCVSFRSPCQTCSSSTLGEDATSQGHRVIDPVSLMHRLLQPDVCDMAKSYNSISPLHTAADTTIVTIPSNQEAICDQATDDYIPLPQEKDIFEGVDDLFGLLEDENRSSESKDSSDSEDRNSFYQACVRKEGGCHLLMVNSKLHSDIERQKSVFSRIVRSNEDSNKKWSNTKAFRQRSVESFDPLYQTKKQRRVQQNTPFPRQNGMLEKPSADRSMGVQALDYSFVWSDNRRSTKFSVRVEDRKKWDASTNESVRDDTWRKPFFLKGGARWEKSSDKELNTPQSIAGVQESRGVSVQEGTPSLNFKWHAKGLKVEGRDHDFDNEDVMEAGQKERSALASFHQEHPCDTALIPKGTKTMDTPATSDGNCKEKSTSLVSKETHTQLGRPYLETKVLLQQQKNIEGCFDCVEDVTRETPLVLERSRSMDSLAESFGGRGTLLNDKTGTHVVAGRLGTETYIQEKPNRSVSTCNGLVNDDKILPLGKTESMDFLPNRNEVCGNKRSLPSDGGDKLVTSCCLETEMPLLQIQTPSIQGFSEVAHDDKVLDPEISEVVFPKFDADCVYKGTSLGSDYISSSDRSRSCARADDQEHSKVVLLNEKQCQNFGSTPELAHENSNSVDSFAVSAAGCGSKSGASAGRTSDQQVTDLLGMNAESRTGFVDDSTPALGIKSVEAYAEQPILQHDPGEATTAL